MQVARSTRVAKALKAIVFGYLGSGLAGLGVGIVAFAYGLGPQDAAVVAPYFGIAGGLVGAAYGVFGPPLRSARG